ncbi:hypothetical protein HaLaN_14651 [Haematococcus lacustris]|uniref:Uncharacterized protein n=1 Tax=Haematococcus lacustris TaxID=44745 RepID=A0A699ZFR8_HAELA|nr:hypothetical protein HaLaN_14651 [Haematococcus lacustris]
MVYGNGLVGILEANYAMAAVSLLSAVAGEQVWDTRLPLPAVSALPPGLASQLSA